MLTDNRFSSAIQSLLDDTDTKRRYRVRSGEDGYVAIEMTLLDGGQTMLEDGMFRIVSARL
jgi:hypothetical protein